MQRRAIGAAIGAVLTGSAAFYSAGTLAVPVPGGTLDPTTIPKYVTPLIIPPVMNKAPGATTNDYDIAVRQFQQQILPGGLWNLINGRSDDLPATTVWSYGPAADPTPQVAPDPTSQFNYPAYTVENTVDTTTTVDWINDLKDPLTGHFLPHLLPVDRSLHWANPEQLACADPTKTKDCRPDPAINGLTLQQPYDGPVPIVTHVHGAHVGPESDGYPEAWWLPDAANIPAGYATQGTLVNQYDPNNPTNTPGIGSFSYPNDQPSTTLWYHDHTLGMTRNNVYAGPAGFWLIRDPNGVNGETGLAAGMILPGPAPVAGDTVLELNAPNLGTGTIDKRSGTREIPIVIQDRSFNDNGTLFYPADRAFFEGIPPADLQIPFIGDPNNRPSDIAPIWNPEAFFNTMVVNGVSWPTLDVAPALYRLRLLNGCNSRFLNLSLKPVDPLTGQPITLRVTQTTVLPNGNLLTRNNVKLTELPFYQIGAEQSLLPQVVRVATGSATPLAGNGTVPASLTKTAHKDQALLMGLAERADVIVDFRSLPNGTVVQMFNTAPDAPFGGFPDVPADPGTTGQVMRFVVNSALAGKSPTDPVLADGTTPNLTAATDPLSLVLGNADPNDPANTAVSGPGNRPLALIEEESALICVTVNAVTGVISQVPGSLPPLCAGGGVPFAPKAAVLGTDVGGVPLVTLWSDPIVTNPGSGTTEAWDISNYTVDGHPIHLHLVKFKVLERRALGTAPGSGGSVVPGNGVSPTENGWKDTVIAYPGETTTVAATFDIDGLYVWHCHIVEHEDNEMMVPYCVGNTASAPGCAGPAGL